MKSLSKSLDRHTFGKNNYIKRQLSKGESIRQDYLAIYDNANQQDEKNEKDPKWAENNLEYDLRSTDWILEKVRNNTAYAQNLYSALCNNDFQRMEVIPILKNETWSCSWRHAGGIVANMIQVGDYIDWYCSGIKNVGNGDDPYADDPNFETKGSVPEGFITEEIRNDLKKLGWIPVDTDQT